MGIWESLQSTAEAGRRGLADPAAASAGAATAIVGTGRAVSAVAGGAIGGAGRAVSAVAGGAIGGAGRAVSAVAGGAIGGAGRAVDAAAGAAMGGAGRAAGAAAGAATAVIGTGRAVGAAAGGAVGAAAGAATGGAGWAAGAAAGAATAVISTGRAVGAAAGGAIGGTGQVVGTVAEKVGAGASDGARRLKAAMPDREGLGTICRIARRITDHVLDEITRPYTCGIPVYRFLKEELAKGGADSSKEKKTKKDWKHKAAGTNTMKSKKGAEKPEDVIHNFMTSGFPGGGSINRNKSPSI